MSSDPRDPRGGAGTLYLVATPIGNLEDITLRAIRTLREVDAVACEDTRRTRGLLAHLGISKATLSLHEHNERARIPQILAMLEEGKDVALASDAGMPAVSDPGAALAAAAARGGFAVVPIPGPSAVTAAVALADFPAERFAFVGFLPRGRGERRRLLDSLARLPMALVAFEAPHRIREALVDMARAFGGRRMLLARELTKVHEEVLRGSADEVREALGEAPRGEITLVIEGTGASTADPDREESAEAFLERLLEAGLSRRDAAAALAIAFRMKPKEAYRLAAEAGDTGERGG